jgi:hypothetical protein
MDHSHGHEAEKFSFLKNIPEMLKDEVQEQMIETDALTIGRVISYG